MKNSFKVGDIVKILPRNGSQEDYHPQYVDGMLKYVGQLATITQVGKISCNIDLNNSYYWPFNALQLVTSEMDKTINSNELKNGDYIKIVDLYTKQFCIYIFKEMIDNKIYRHAAYFSIFKNIDICSNKFYSINNYIKITYATEEEKKLFDNALLKKGYRWNSLTNQLEIIGVVDLPTNGLAVQSVLRNSIYGSIQKVDDMFTGTLSCTKEEKQTETELNLFPEKKHYQLNFNY